MEENKRNNALDNLSKNEKSLYEILGMVREIKSRINGSIPLCQKVKGELEPEQNTINGKIGKQSGIITDIFEELRIIFDLV